MNAWEAYLAPDPRVDPATWDPFGLSIGPTDAEPVYRGAMADGKADEGGEAPARRHAAWRHEAGGSVMSQSDRGTPRSSEHPDALEPALQPWALQQAAADVLAEAATVVRFPAVHPLTVWPIMEAYIARLQQARHCADWLLPAADHEALLAAAMEAPARPLAVQIEHALATAVRQRRLLRLGRTDHAARHQA